MVFREAAAVADPEAVVEELVVLEVGADAVEAGVVLALAGPAAVVVVVHAEDHPAGAVDAAVVRPRVALGGRRGEDGRRPVAVAEREERVFAAEEEGPARPLARGDEAQGRPEAGHDLVGRVLEVPAPELALDRAHPVEGRVAFAPDRRLAEGVGAGDADPGAHLARRRRRRDGRGRRELADAREGVGGE